MALFTIGDLHLALGCDKPMDIFKGWEGYVERLRESWLENVAPDDTVVLPGDISWAMKLENCYEDFSFIHALPGKKWLLKGNHDYWWTTRSKMERYLAEKGLDTIGFIHNDCAVYEGVALCGTRSWLFEAGEPHDQKVAAREAGRLRASLEGAARLYPAAEKLVFLHYPPVYPGASSDEIIALMREYGVQRCFYGHLHGASIRRAVQGVHNGIHYHLVSADSLAFKPFRII